MELETKSHPSKISGMHVFSSFKKEMPERPERITKNKFDYMYKNTSLFKKSPKKATKLTEKDFDKDSKIVRINPVNVSSTLNPENHKKRESGGMKKLKNTMRLKSKQFKDFPKAKEKSDANKNDFKTTKSFNALALIDKCIKKNSKINNSEKQRHHDRSLSQKFGINIPIYKLSEKNSSIFKQTKQPTQFQSQSMNSRKHSKRYSQRPTKLEGNTYDSHSKPPLKCIEALATTKREQKHFVGDMKKHQLKIYPLNFPASPMSVCKAIKDINSLATKTNKATKFVSTPSNKISSQFTKKLRQDIKMSVKKNQIKESISKKSLQVNPGLKCIDSKSSFLSHGRGASLDVRLKKDFQPFRTKDEFDSGDNLQAKTADIDKNVIKSDTSVSKIEVVLPQIGITSSRFIKNTKNKTQHINIEPSLKINFQHTKIKKGQIFINSPSSPTQNFAKHLNLKDFNVKKASKYLKRYVQNKSIQNKPVKPSPKPKLFKPIKVRQLSISQKDEQIEGWAIEENEFVHDFL
ncbi:unnamed protein product [Moneuplotes crassus]|uniref:Uncharacterized protein n=1 Tax=Euplotes crassus TaxID=5936 RepID=A0AAD1X8X2_EUPCR|nr:unnamed protein product [Moneuplotes crassus]